MVEDKRDLRPNRRNRTAGEALIRASTIEFERPRVKIEDVDRYVSDPWRVRAQ
jgi:hypothetical protein